MTEFRNNYKYYEKFWKRRYKLFSKFDQGIIIDSLESWYSVTPEAIARDQAEYCYEMLNSRNITILDGYCGIGGNSIQFAKIFHKVIAIDIDPIKIEAAKNNAKIYGVEDKIEFIVGQTPLPNTKLHHYQMLHENKVDIELIISFAGNTKALATGKVYHTGNLSRRVLTATQICQNLIMS